MEVTRLGEGLGVPRLWEVKSGGCRWAGCFQPGFSCGRSCASEADEGPEWPPVTFCPYWRGGQRSTESSPVGDFSGAVGSEVTFCSTSPSSASWESPPRPAPQPALGSPRLGLDGLRCQGAGARLGPCCAALITAVTASWILSLQLRPSSLGLALEGCHFAFQCEV